MKLYSVLLSVYLIGTVFCEDIVCPKNCVYKKCVDPCPKTCDNLNSEMSCSRKKCTSGCQCLGGYVLHQGDCIPINECPGFQCGLNAFYSEAPCSSSCANMFTKAGCDRGEHAGCQCLEGYFKNEHGECVSAMECAVEEVICPSNSSFSTCASSCPITCENQYLDIPCDRMCNIRCDCDPGYVYNEFQECVPLETCDPQKVICPRPGQTFNPCTFKRTCNNMYDVLVGHCRPSCVCNTGEAWDENIGACVPYGECENSVQNKACRRLDKNSKYYSKHPVELSTCKNPHPLPTGYKDSGCFCKEGYVLNSKHQCVLLEHCCGCRDFN